MPDPDTDRSQSFPVFRNDSFNTFFGLFRLFYVCIGSIETPNILFRYLTETTETNVLFQIVSKLVSVPVSVVSNRN
jgi:hypothetical protein